MMKLPRLNPKQKKDIDTMKMTEGWRLMRQALEGNIKLKDMELRSYDFKFDEDGEVNKKKILEFKIKQNESIILKNFLQLIDDPVILKKESEDDMYGEPDKGKN